MPNEPNEPSTESLDLLLSRLIRSKSCIIYHENMLDPEYPDVRCSIYGVPKTNELVVRLTNGKISFAGVVASPVTFPVMSDRLFGMVPADHAVAFALADRLWESHRSELIGEISP
jgi:hypothetical protein